MRPALPLLEGEALVLPEVGLFELAFGLQLTRCVQQLLLFARQLQLGVHHGLLGRNRRLFGLRRLLALELLHLLALVGGVVRLVPFMPPVIVTTYCTISVLAQNYSYLS